MRATGTYRTKQRQLIWAYLQEHKNVHIVAEDIVEYLRAQGTAVGKSTVYRYLDKLVLEGHVRKFFLEEGMSACFQLAQGAGCREHFHLKCLKCGRLMHLECETLAEVDRHIFESHRFQVDSSKTIFYGVCGDCAACGRPAAQEEKD